MSLFQCERCGVVENTACSSMGHCYALMNWDYEKKDPRSFKALQSYKAILGLADDEPFPQLCSACSPVWYKDGNYGVGPNPNPEPGEGMWHGEWPQKFLPLGEYMTDPRTGDLVRKDEYVEPPPPPPRRYRGAGERVPIHMENPHFTEAQNRAARRAALHKRRK